MMRKTWMVGVCALLVVISVFPVYAENNTPSYDLKDFYYYDEENTVKRLTIAPKILVRFLWKFPESEETEFLARFSPLSQNKDPQEATRFILEFSPSTPPFQILEKIREISLTGIAEGVPVVLVENIEAVAEGVAIVPKTVMSLEAVQERIKRFGEFKVRQTRTENSALILLLDEIKPPLHLYILANLIKQDAWVKRAYPYFRFLHNAITAHLSAEPVSGTLGEARTIRLSISIFDPKISVKEEFIPSFGEGNFIPKTGNGVVPSLFFSVTEKSEPKEISHARGRVIDYRWKFKHFAVGEWTVAGQPIAYEKNGESPKITSTSATFVVTSLIGSLAIDDMPPPKVLVVPGRSLPIGSPVSTVLPAYWFDRWISDPSQVARHSFWISLVFFAGALLVLAWEVSPYLEQVRGRSSAQARFLRECQAVCLEARKNVSKDSYKKLQDVVHRVLRAAFPNELPPHPELGEVKDKVGVRIGGGVLSLLEEIYAGLGERFKPSFEPDRAELERIADGVLDLVGRLRYRIKEVPGEKES